MDVIKLKVAVVLMIPLIDFSNKTFDFLSLHSMIETVEQNRDGFLKEVFHEYRSFLNFDIYDSKTTSFR